MKEKNINRTKFLHLRLKPDEYKKIHQQFTNTTCRKLSEYARKILLNKPITTTYRNQSLDDFMAELIRLKNELNSIGNNLNQAVKKLYTLNQISEFKSWLFTHDIEKKMLSGKIDEIKNYIQKMGEKWLQ